MKQLETLIEDCKKNDRKAQSAIYDMFYDTLMRVARRYKNNNDDAAMLVNKAFFKVFTQLDKYQPPIPFESWIKRITINTIIDDFRKTKKIKELETSIDQNPWLENTSKEEYNLIESNINAKDILKLIDALDDGEKTVFNLFEMEGMSHQHIAEQLMVSERTSKRYLMQARATLKVSIVRLLATAKTFLL